MEYEIKFMPDGKTISCVYEPSIGFIPLDEDNLDYQAYLLWLQGQETPTS